MKLTLQLLTFILAGVFFLTLLSCKKASSSYETEAVRLDCENCLGYFAVDVNKWRDEFINADSISIQGCPGDCSYYFDFSKNSQLEVTYGALRFNYETRASQIGVLFPESSKLTRPGGNTWRGKIEVFASEHDHDHRVWILVFKNETLKLMYLYDPFADL